MGFVDGAMAFPIRGWLVLIALTFSTISPASAAEPKRVLLLHSFGPQFAPFVYIAEQFRDELFRQSPDKIDLYEASLEGGRFQQSDEQGPLVDYLDALFRSKKLDLVVTIGAPAVHNRHPSPVPCSRHLGSEGGRCAVM